MADDFLTELAGPSKEKDQERHRERNQLRGELNAAPERLEELRRKEAGAAAAEEGESTEESLLDEAGPTGIQPVRVPEFSRKFRESLEELPPRAVRQAMSLIGRLAAGEGGAFVGIKRLKANREIVRQRVGAIIGFCSGFTTKRSSFLR